MPTSLRRSTIDVRQSSFSELLAANSFRTAFTSTAGWGDTVAGGAVGSTVLGVELLDAVAGDAVGATVLGIELLLDEVTGAAEAVLGAEEAVVCPKILDIRLENIPIRKDRVKDRYCQDFAARSTFGALTTKEFRRGHREHAHEHRVAQCFHEPRLFLDSLLQDLRTLRACVVH